MQIIIYNNNYNNNFFIVEYYERKVKMLALYQSFTQVK